MFRALIDLVPGPVSGHFVGPPAPERTGRTYGGQLLAQGVAATYRTVDDDRRIHSIHAAFLRAGAVDRPTRWEVAAVRDGRSFATREAVGLQEDRELFRMVASFHVAESGFEYDPDPSPPPGAIPEPEAVPMTYVEFARSHPDFVEGTWAGHERPMEIRYVDPPPPEGGPPVTEAQLTWTRITDSLADVPPGHAVHDAGLAYLSDATLIDHVLLPHGHRWHDRRLTGASLDHAMWFHRPARADRWLRFDQTVETTSGGRGLATGRLRTADGQLVATCAQEGLIRWTAG